MEKQQLYLLSCTPVPDLAVLLFSTSFDPSLPPAHASSSSSSSSSGGPGEEEQSDVLPQHRIDPAASNSQEVDASGRVKLLGGFAGYTFGQASDLAALVWMRQHLQLLLELAVSGYNL
jgi:hypothetical protein